MNVSLTNKDAVSAIIKIDIVKADYEENVDKNLRSLRQKVTMPGFRKGMVPLGMVKKLYGKSALAEEIEKLVSENLFKYIRENEVKVLGEPLPSETEQSKLDFDTQEDFEFVFDVALAPEIEITLNKRDKAPFYKVAIDDAMVQQQIEAYQANFGSYDQVKDDIQEKDLVKGLVAELENDLPKEGGIVVEDAVLMPQYIKDEAEKAKFIGASVNSVVIFNPLKAYEGTEVEIASFLKIDKSLVAETTSDFSFEIQEITRHIPAELNQELFDKVFAEGEVTNEEEFRAKIHEVLAEQFAPQATYKFMEDTRAMLLKKAGDMNFADDLLKRWLLVANEKNTMEKIEDEYPQIVEDLKYQLIKEYLIKKNDIKVEKEDIDNLAKRVAKAQFAQYGMLTVPDDVLANYATDMLKNKDTLQNIIDRTLEEKMAEWLKEQIKIEEKEVSMEEFNKLFD